MLNSIAHGAFRVFDTAEQEVYVCSKIAADRYGVRLIVNLLKFTAIYT